MISGVNSTGNVPNNQPGINTQSIDQKIQQLKEELRKIKGNKNLPAKEREKRIENIEKQIQKLEEQKKRMQKKASENDSIKENGVNKPLDETPGNYMDVPTSSWRC